jgi:hypothetical protein
MFGVAACVIVGIVVAVSMRDSMSRIFFIRRFL